MDRWVTEIGAPAAGIDNLDYASPKTQRRRLEGMFKKLSAQARVTAFLVFRLQDEIKDGLLVSPNEFGVVAPNGSPRPAYCRLASRMPVSYPC
jgi:hypothetical protein